MMSNLLFILAVLVLQMLPGAGGEPPQQPRDRQVIEDFENNGVGKNPTGWKYIHERKELRDVAPEPLKDNDYFEIRQEQGNKFVRVYTKGETTSLIRLNGEGYNWNLQEHPRLSWRWRALRLPEGAREDEDRLNDAGAAVYVTFSKDVIGRPRSIKYTYSSTLPVGTVVSYGRLKVLVVASAQEGLGKWEQVSRNVVDDYRQLFGGEPPDTPISIAIWSDSNDTGGIATADFDDLALGAALKRRR